MNEKEETPKVDEAKDETKPVEFSLVQVPTQHTLAVQTPEGDVISQEELLVRIANDMEKVRKGIVG